MITPPPAPEVQALCSVVVWYNPEISCEDINGYDVRLYNPQLAGQQNVTRHVDAKGTFYIINDEDRLFDIDKIHVQVDCIVHYKLEVIHTLSLF